jgi:hypothetical protein
VHAAAIAATSQQLNALINGGMEEAEKRSATIEDVRVDDFIRFCEYAYRGDYTVPPWGEVPPELSSTSETNQQNKDDDWDWNLPSKKKKGKKGRAICEEPVPAAPDVLAPPISMTTLQTQFNCRNYVYDSDPKALLLEHFEPKPNSAADQNFAPVLLAHARLYCFAHLRLIAPLKALTLNKLHKTLIGFKLYTQRVGDIIELARYAYSHQDMPDRKDNGKLDELRRLVVEYIVCEIATIGKCDEFVNYVEEGGEFVGDFWRLARDYIA